MGDMKEEELLQEALQVTERVRELEEEVETAVGRRYGDEHSLLQRVSTLDSLFRGVSSSFDAKRAELDLKTIDKIEEELYKAQWILNEGDVAALLPSRTHGRFLKMVLGPVDVRVSRKEEKLKIKEEYNKYRDKTAFLFLLFPSTLLVLRSWIWNGCFPALPVQLYQAWLLYLYTNLALRENILRANGSDIRPWWIYHHYCTMLMALVSLTWEIKGEPDCANKQRGVQLLLAWAIMQGIAMLLQNRYQRQRLYTRIALGKAKRMDVVWGEAAGVEGQLWLLYPILFTLQAFEAYVGMLLLKTALDGVIPQWQVIVCGVLLVVMAVGNFMNTVQTLVSKFRFKAKVKKLKAKHDLQADLKSS
ncbi:Transmembrane protein [Rhynchospora pubera]|uniref:Transmembrane protein n=1 Tax=Rhynchospora pubera TaxID=906938 RepID=A0AAV8GEF1_9POAL|nr:Transmembrane protein [Rhynchospora pubera]